jgi:hypothetical protein
MTTQIRLKTGRVIEAYSWAGTDGAPEFGVTGLEQASREELLEAAQRAICEYDALRKRMAGEEPFKGRTFSGRRV